MVSRECARLVLCSIALLISAFRERQKTLLSEVFRSGLGISFAEILCELLAPAENHTPQIFPAFVINVSKSGLIAYQSLHELAKSKIKIHATARKRSEKRRSVSA